MQTISLPYAASDDEAATIAEWQRLQSSVDRSAYAQAHDAEGVLRSEADLKTILNARFPDHPLGSWAVHCAARDGLKMRRQHPDGTVIFGGRAQFERRRKGLISAEDWRLRRQSRPISIIGDRTRWGNRHLRLSEDGLAATITFLKQSVTLRLPEMTGKTGKLVRALAKLTAACEIGVTFALNAKTLTLTFDPMDLRRLAPGETLEGVERAEREARGHKPRGRPRKDAATHYAAHRVRPIPVAERPVHPEWRVAIPTLTRRAVGIDLNPEWIGLSVVEIPVGAKTRDCDQVTILDHRIVRLTIPIEAASEAMSATMARTARMAISLARKWGCATIFHEDGLGRLRWSKRWRKRPKVQTVNYWSRNALLGELARRCALSGLQLEAVWGGYSSTIGNLLFPLPDACAAATEIARRGLASARGEKDRLPAVPPRVRLRRWKDGELPEPIAKAIDEAECWRSVHRAVKPTQGRGFPPAVGYRRPHPPLAAGPGPLQIECEGFVVQSKGCRKGGWITAARPAARMVA